MNIVEEVKNLGLPEGKYIVVGSGIMAAHGIRPSADVDIFASEAVFEAFEKKEGWEKKPIGLRPGEKLCKGIVEIYKTFAASGKDFFLDDLLSRAEIIDGVAFLSFADLIAFKILVGREKDFADIALIKDYLYSRHA